MMFRIVLFHPEIPYNTGNISRLCVGANCQLNLVRPLGFSLDDRYLQRAGLDHWGDLDLKLHDDLTQILQDSPSGRLVLFTKRAARLYWEHDYHIGDTLVFGAETSGLPPEITAQYSEACYALPIIGPVRSLNLANSAAIAIYEGLRQLALKNQLPARKTSWPKADLQESFDIAPARAAIQKKK